MLDIAFSSITNLFDYRDVETNKFYEHYYGVINISSKILSKADISLLGKGLKFCPTLPVYDHSRLKESIDCLFRTMSLYLFFHSENNSEEMIQNITPRTFEHPELKLPSTFNPPRPSNLDHMYDLVIEPILSHNPKKQRKRNMLNCQYTAMFNLQNDYNIIIKKADKGSNIVLMDKNKYIQEGMHQLSNTKFYKPVRSDLTKKHRRIVQNLVSKMHDNNEISDKTFWYLSTGGTRTSVFYMLPKIHKDIRNPPGRPIVSSVDSPTEKISQMLDLILKPLVMGHTRFY